MAFSKSVRKRLLVQHGYKCAICGYDEHPEVLEAAHIVKHCDNPDATTDITGTILCPTCHKVYDRGLFTSKELSNHFNKKLTPEMRKYYETGEWPSWAK